MRDDYALRTFRAIAEHGSFTRAAAALDVTASSLSQVLRQLEKQFGTRLLHRTTRKVGLTEAGSDLLRRIAPALDELDAAMDTVREHAGQPRGTLRVTVPHIVVGYLIEPVLARFMTAWPDLHVDIHVDDSLSDLVAGGFDAGIRLGERLQRDMVAVPISGPMRPMVVGSPDYFERRGMPKHPRDLSAHDCVKYRYTSSGALYRWEFAHNKGAQKGRWFDLPVNGSLTVNTMALATRAAEDGIGLTYTFETFVREQIANGRLKNALKSWLPSIEGFYLYYPTRFQVPPKLRVFIDALQEHQKAIR